MRSQHVDIVLGDMDATPPRIQSSNPMGSLGGGVQIDDAVGLIIGDDHVRKLRQHFIAKPVGFIGARLIYRGTDITHRRRVSDEPLGLVTYIAASALVSYFARSCL